MRNKYRVGMKPLYIEARDREDARKQFLKMVRDEYKTFSNFAYANVKIRLEEGFEYSIVSRKK